MSAPDNVLRHQECWAKTTTDGRPGISVRDHCLNVGCVAEALLELLPDHLRELLPPSAATLAALHDVGKVSQGFQSKCEAWLVRHGLRDRALNEGWRMREPDHAKISQFTVQELLGLSRLYGWAAVLGAHHGRIKGERVSLREPWEEERRRLARELAREFGPLPDQPPDDATLWFVAGLITIADWIGSDERHFPQEALGDILDRRRRGQAALANINWKRVAARQLSGFADLFPQIQDANSLQTATLQTVREAGIYVLEGPMGCGKTEAALTAAYQLIAAGKANGIYFALPTQLTSNRIHLRVQPFVDRISAETGTVRLAHSASWLVETEPPPNLRPASHDDDEAQEHVRAGRSWFASPKRALLAPFGVGTVDQALLGVVAAKHFFVRQFGLAGKVVILDEVHSYDLYTGTLIGVLVKRLRELHCTVIVLSATLTAARRRQLLQVGDVQPLSSAYPLLSGGPSPLTEVPCDPPAPKTVAVRFVETHTVVEDCLERAGRGQCVLWIRNTVDDAQETYRTVKGANREGGPSIALLHSRFPFHRREELEDEWMKRLGKDANNRPNGCVLVTTQVAEQSVDIDADLLITDLAPTDMLLQRLGRLWRHERPQRPCAQPEIWIHNVPLSDEQAEALPARALKRVFDKSARVYSPYVLLRSLEQWRGRAAVTLPADIRTILEATYAEPSAPEPGAWRELRHETEQKRRELAALALSATNIWTQPPLPDEETVQTRYSTYKTAQILLATKITPLDSHSVRLRLLDGAVVIACDREWDFKAAKAIYRNLARMPRWALAAALSDQPGWLANYVSQPTALGLIGADGGIGWLGSGTETGLSYHAEQGIIIKRERVQRAPQEELDESYD